MGEAYNWVVSICLKILDYSGIVLAFNIVRTEQWILIFCVSRSSNKQKQKQDLKGYHLWGVSSVRCSICRGNQLLEKRLIWRKDSDLNRRLNVTFFGRSGEIKEKKGLKMSAPKLPLTEISGYDQGQLKQVSMDDKSGVTSQDKILATIAKGGVSLKHAEPNVKTWMPTKEELEEERKQQAWMGVWHSALWTNSVRKWDTVGRDSNCVSNCLIFAHSALSFHGHVINLVMSCHVLSWLFRKHVMSRLCHAKEMVLMGILEGMW